MNSEDKKKRPGVLGEGCDASNREASTSSNQDYRPQSIEIVSIESDLHFLLR